MTKQEEFEEAVQNNDIDKFKSLINDSDIFIAYREDTALRISVSNGNYEMVKLLLETGKTSPKTFNSKCLHYAVIEGFIDIVELLLEDKRADPAADENSCIIHAILNEKWDLALILWKDDRVKDTLENDDKDMYNKVIEKILQNKITEF